MLYILEKANLAYIDPLHNIDKSHIRTLLQNLDLEPIMDEISPNGIGVEYHNILSQGSKIEAGEFLRWLYAEINGNNAIMFLNENFKHVEVVEHYGSKWTIKCSRDDHKIGYLFGLLQDMKEEFHISEYSASSTTLEQIFNNFAT